MTTGAEPAALAPGAVLGQARDENFPVASRLLPRAARADLMALYGFARLVDDAGDEAEGDRRVLLDELERDLRLVYDGQPRHELIRALVPTVRAHGIPAEPFLRLIAANRADQEVQRYETFDQLIDYCRLSANPVGELVLYAFDAATPKRIALSDSICSALQIVEHLQDVIEDLERGRVYLPAADMRRFAVATADLAISPAPAPVRSLIEFEASRAEAMLVAGLPLARTLALRPALAVRAFAAGGFAAIAALRRAGFDVSGGAPRASTVLRLRMFLAPLPKR